MTYYQTLHRASSRRLVLLDGSHGFFNDMATTSSTPGAPKSIDDLKLLLNEDVKVKVAG